MRKPPKSMYALAKSYILEGLKRDLGLRGYAKEEIHDLTRKYDPRRQSHKQKKSSNFIDNAS